MRRLAALLIAVALLVAAACGDDDEAAGEDGSERDDYVAALRAEIAADEEVPLDDDEADCLAERIVDAIGVDYLEEQGYDPGSIGDDEAGADLPDLTEEQVAGIAGSFRACDINLFAVFAQSAGDDVTPEGVDCLEENIDEELLADLFAASFAGEDLENADPELQQRMFEAVTPCAQFFAE